MNKDAFQRQAKLQELAQNDPVYQTWANSYADCREAFARFAETQPDETRNMLYGYAECGRLMQQRLINLACHHMRFPEE